MVRRVASRLAGSVVVVFIISLVTFAIFQLVPRLTGVDMAYYYTGKGSSPAQAAAIMSKFGFDKPALEQYWQFVSGIFLGRDFGNGTVVVHCIAPCLGYSFRQNRPVIEMIGDALPITLSLTVGAGVLWLIFGIAGGTIAAAFRGRWPDRAITSVALLGVSLPEFFIGMLLIYVLTAGPAWLRLYPSGINYVPIGTDPGAWFMGMLPAWACLAFLSASIYVRLTRASMIDAMHEDFITTARAKGLRPVEVTVRHGLRVVVPPLATIVGIDIGVLLGGAVLIETIFSFPGMGKLAYSAIASKDLPVIMGVTLVSATAIVVMNLVIDLCYRFLDPRAGEARG